MLRRVYDDLIGNVLVHNVGACHGRQEGRQVWRL